MGSTVYSQGKEQEVIANYFGSKAGKLLDIGAHDGEQSFQVKHRRYLLG